MSIVNSLIHAAKLLTEVSTAALPGEGSEVAKARESNSFSLTCGAQEPGKAFQMNWLFQETAKINAQRHIWWFGKDAHVTPLDRHRYAVARRKMFLDLSQNVITHFDSNSKNYAALIVDQFSPEEIVRFINRKTQIDVFQQLIDVSDTKYAASLVTHLVPSGYTPNDLKDTRIYLLKNLKYSDQLTCALMSHRKSSAKMALAYAGDRRVIPTLIAAAKKGNYGAIRTLDIFEPNLQPEDQEIVLALIQAYTDERLDSWGKAKPAAKDALNGVIERFRAGKPADRRVKKEVAHTFLRLYRTNSYYSRDELWSIKFLVDIAEPGDSLVTHHLLSHLTPLSMFQTPRTKNSNIDDRITFITKAIKRIGGVKVKELDSKQFDAYVESVRVNYGPEKAESICSDSLYYPKLLVERLDTIAKHVDIHDIFRHIESSLHNPKFVRDNLETLARHINSKAMLNYLKPDQFERYMRTVAISKGSEGVKLVYADALENPKFRNNALQRLAKDVVKTTENVIVIMNNTEIIDGVISTLRETSEDKPELLKAGLTILSKTSKYGRAAGLETGFFKRLQKSEFSPEIRSRASLLEDLAKTENKIERISRRQRKIRPNSHLAKKLDDAFRTQVKKRSALLGELFGTQPPSVRYRRKARVAYLKKLTRDIRDPYRGPLVLSKLFLRIERDQNKEFIKAVLIAIKRIPAKDERSLTTIVREAVHSGDKVLPMMEDAGLSKLLKGRRYPKGVREAAQSLAKLTKVRMQISQLKEEFKDSKYNKSDYASFYKKLAKLRSERRELVDKILGRDKALANAKEDTWRIATNPILSKKFKTPTLLSQKWGSVKWGSVNGHKIPATLKRDIDLIMGNSAKTYNHYFEIGFMLYLMEMLDNAIHPSSPSDSKTTSP